MWGDRSGFHNPGSRGLGAQLSAECAGVSPVPPEAQGEQLCVSASKDMGCLAVGLHLAFVGLSPHSSSLLRVQPASNSRGSWLSSPSCPPPHP